MAVGAEPSAVSWSRVQACLAAGVLRGDAHEIATLLRTAAHGAAAAVLTFPDFPFGDPAAYAARVVDRTLAALATDVVAPLGHATLGAHSGLGGSSSWSSSVAALARCFSDPAYLARIRPDAAAFLDLHARDVVVSTEHVVAA